MKTHGKREDGGVLFRAGLWGQLEHAGDFLADVSEKSVERGRDVRVAGVRGPSGMPGRGSGGLRGCVGHGGSGDGVGGGRQVGEAKGETRPASDTGRCPGRTPTAVTPPWPSVTP